MQDLHTEWKSFKTIQTLVCIAGQQFWAFFIVLYLKIQIEKIFPAFNLAKNLSDDGNEYECGLKQLFTPVEKVYFVIFLFYILYWGRLVRIFDFLYFTRIYKSF